LLRLGEITEIVIPSLEQEAARGRWKRGKTRAGIWCAPGTGSPSSCCARASSIPAARRAGQHEAWLNRQKFGAAPLQLAYDTSEIIASTVYI